MTVPTLDEIVDSLLTASDFEETASISKAQAFVTAAKRFLLLSPASQSDQGSSLAMNSAQVENLLRRAQEYIALSNRTSATNTSVRFFSVNGNYRW